MTTTELEAIKHAIATRLTAMTLSPGTVISQTRWSPYAIRSRQAAQVFVLGEMALGKQRPAPATDQAGTHPPWKLSG